MKSYVVDIEVLFHHETEKAVLVSVDGASEKVWLPKSQIEWEEGIDAKPGMALDITLPQKLAEEKGLV